MTQLEYLLATLIAAVVGHGIIMLYRSPKELFKAIESKIDEIEDNHTSLDRMLTRHDEVVKNLSASIDRLTARIDRIEPYLKPPGRQRG